MPITLETRPLNTAETAAPAEVAMSTPAALDLDAGQGRVVVRPKLSGDHPFGHRPRQLPFVGLKLCPDDLTFWRSGKPRLR